MPSEKFIIDNGGSVTYKGYSIEAIEHEGKVRYWGKHETGSLSDVGICYHPRDVKRFIDQLVPNRIVHSQPVETCQNCGRLCYELNEWRGRKICWYPCLLETIEAENAEWEAHQETVKRPTDIQ